MTAFNESQFEKKLQNLKDSQEAIQTLSNWCLQHRTSHKKIVSSWLRVLKKVKIEHRLTLFYLANDVIQYSKRKSYEFVESWGTALQRATTMVREEKVKHRVLRIFKIWDERGIYDEAFIADLCGLLSTTTKKNATENNPDPVDFQPTVLINKIRSCKKVEDDTDVKFKRVKDSHLSLSDADALRSHLKDRRQGDDVVAEVDEGVNKLQGYVKALESEIKERGELIELLEQGQAFYDNQKGEAKVVANAYRNFGTRVKNLKRRLDEMMPSLKDVSPIPSPPNVEDAPSPSPDSDVDIPGLNSTNPDFIDSYIPPPSQPIRTVMEESQHEKPVDSFSSFLGNALPFDVQKNLFSESSGGILSPPPEPVQEDPGGVSQQSDIVAEEGKPIEVISSRTKSEETFNIADFLKSLIPSRTETIPGLTLDTADHPTSSDLSKPAYTEPPPPILSQPPPAYDYPPATTTSTPLQPPPIPPNLFPLEDTSQYKYGQPPETEDSWNTKLPPKFPTWGETTNAGWEASEGSDKVSEWMPAMPVNKVAPVEIVDTPESPPMYEKEGFSDPVEYDDSVIEPTLLSASTDVDHRTLVPLPLANHSIEEPIIPSNDRLEDTDHRLLMHVSTTNHVKKDVDHRPIVHRKKDVDHRNLISLTGSPMREPHAPLVPPPTPPNLPWPRGDQDYRSQVARKKDATAVKVDEINNEDMDYRHKGQRPKASDEMQDNVESVDMEMSDEEVMDSTGGDSLPGLKTEASPVKNMQDVHNSKATISFNITSPAKLLSNSPLNEIKEDPSRLRNRVYGCQRIPTIGAGTHSPRMMRFPLPSPPRLPFPSPRNMRPGLLAPPPPPPPLVPQFNAVRIRPITELIHLSQNANEIPPPVSMKETALSTNSSALGGASEEDLSEADASQWKPVTESESVGAEQSADKISAVPMNPTPPPLPPWNINQEVSSDSTLSSGTEKEPQSTVEGSEQSTSNVNWSADKSGAQETWTNDNVPGFEVHEVERLNSYDRGRGRGRGANFKNFSTMPQSPQSGLRGAFNHRGRPGWAPRRGGPQVPPPPPPPPMPRFPFRPPMDSFRGARGGFRLPFRGNNPRHFGW